MSVIVPKLKKNIIIALILHRLWGQRMGMVAMTLQGPVWKKRIVFVLVI